MSLFGDFLFFDVVFTVVLLELIRRSSHKPFSEDESCTPLKVSCLRPYGLLLRFFIKSHWLSIPLPQWFSLRFHEIQWFSRPQNEELSMKFHSVLLENPLFPNDFQWIWFSLICCAIPWALPTQHPKVCQTIILPLHWTQYPKDFHCNVNEFSWHLVGFPYSTPPYDSHVFFSQHSNGFLTQHTNHCKSLCVLS